MNSKPPKVNAWRPTLGVGVLLGAALLLSSKAFFGEGPVGLLLGLAIGIVVYQLLDQTGRRRPAEAPATRNEE